MNFGEVLSRSWQIFWKHKVLWIFGILAGCSSASSGTSNFRSNYQQNLPHDWGYQLNIPDWQVAVLVIILILIVLFLVVVATFLGTMGRIGLIRGTQKIEGGQTSLTFGELFNGSLPYFWRVFFLNLLIGLAIAVIAVIFAIAAVLGTFMTLGILLICLVPLACLLVPLGWLVNIVIEQANIAIVTEDLGIMDGLQRGWQVFRENLGNMIVMGLILILGVSLIGGFIIGLPFALILAPAIVGAVAGTDQGLAGGFLVTGLCLVGYIPVMIFLNGLLRGYIETAWTLTYLRLTGAAPAPLASEPMPPAPEPLPPSQPEPEALDQPKESSFLDAGKTEAPSAPDVPEPAEAPESLDEPEPPAEPEAPADSEPPLPLAE